MIYSSYFVVYNFILANTSLLKNTFLYRGDLRIISYYKIDFGILLLLKCWLLV